VVCVGCSLNVLPKLEMNFVVIKFVDKVLNQCRSNCSFVRRREKLLAWKSKLLNLKTRRKLWSSWTYQLKNDVNSYLLIRLIWRKYGPDACERILKESKKKIIWKWLFIFIYIGSPISVVISNRLLPYYLFFILLHFQFVVTWQIFLKYFTHIIRLSPSHRPTKYRLIILIYSEVYLLESYLHRLLTLSTPLGL
jgi:hypothetical protein